jgi:cytochrome c oxidase assembly protein subunit 11
MTEGRAPDMRVRNRAVVRRLLVVAVAMFGFGYLMVPLYEVFCEVTGIREIMRADQPVVNTQVDASRTVRLELDGNLRNLPWQFHPKQPVVDVHPGELKQVVYEVVNTTDRPVTGQAVPSYAPQLAANYFRKLECFCFTTQTLAPGERREMPVVLVLDPKLPADVNVVTLSYTFFEVAGAAKVAARAQSGESR